MPLDFALSEEQDAIRQLAHEFAEKEIRPVAWPPGPRSKSNAGL